MTTKPPTAASISRLLAKAGETRAIFRLRGGVSGYRCIQDGCAGGTVVAYVHSMQQGREAASRRALGRYTKILESAGCGVTQDAERDCLTITARED